MGDSVSKLKNPVIHLRYTNPSMLLSLACLMEIDSLALKTGQLESLESKGWQADKIAPPAGSIKMIHYRSDDNPSDMLVKVLLNEQETRLPINTDCAPYYHWRDFRRHYLKKIERYEKERSKKP